MHDYRPITQSIKDRIELILVEEANRAQPETIDAYIDQTANRLMALFIDELNYHASRFR